jgi:hypothetical protein
LCPDKAASVALYLGEFTIANFFELRLGDTSKPDDALIAYDERRTAVDDGAHRQLPLEGHTDLAHQNEVQRRIERRRDLRGHDNAAARQRENDRPQVLVLRQRRRQLMSCVRSIRERHCIPSGAMGGNFCRILIARRSERLFDADQQYRGSEPSLRGSSRSGN